MRRDNPSFHPQKLNDEEEEPDNQRPNHIRSSVIIQSDVKPQEPEETHLQSFGKELVNHCVDNPPNQLKIFSDFEFKRIMEYMWKGYMEKYN